MFFELVRNGLDSFGLNPYSKFSSGINPQIKNLVDSNTFDGLIQFSNKLAQKYLNQPNILHSGLIPDENFEKGFNSSQFERFRYLFLNHFESIQKTLWISFDSNQLKINPAQSNSFRFNPKKIQINQSRIDPKRSFRSRIHSD